MQRMLAANISDGVTEIIEVLSDAHALAITAQIEAHGLRWVLSAKRSGHEDFGIGIVNRGGGYANAGQRKRSGDATGTCGRVCKIYFRITLAQSPRGPMKTKHGLVQQMIIKCISMGQRKITRSVWDSLGKSRQPHGRKT